MFFFSKLFIRIDFKIKIRIDFKIKIRIHFRSQSDLQQTIFNGHKLLYTYYAYKCNKKKKIMRKL